MSEHVERRRGLVAGLALSLARCLDEQRDAQQLVLDLFGVAAPVARHRHEPPMVGCEHERAGVPGADRLEVTDHVADGLVDRPDLQGLQREQLGHVALVAG